MESMRGSKEARDRYEKAFALACRLLGGDQWKKVQVDVLSTVDTEPVCKVRGCTERNACPGGCWWVEENLCSACVGEG